MSNENDNQLPLLFIFFFLFTRRKPENPAAQTRQRKRKGCKSTGNVLGLQREQCRWVNGAGGSAADVGNEWGGEQWLRRDGQVVVISLVDGLLNSPCSVNILFRRR